MKVLLVCVVLLAACGSGADKDGKRIDLGNGVVSGSGVAADGSLLFDLGSGATARTWRLSPDDELEQLPTRGLSSMLVASDGRSLGCFVRNRTVFTAEYDSGTFGDQTEVFELSEDNDECGECSSGIRRCSLFEDGDGRLSIAIVLWNQYDDEGRETLVSGPFDGDLEGSDEVEGSVYVGWGGKLLGMVNSDRGRACGMDVWHCVSQIDEDGAEVLIRDDAILMGHAYSPQRAFAAVAFLEPGSPHLGRDLPEVTIFDDNNGAGLGRSVDRLESNITSLRMAVVGGTPVAAYIRGERGVTVRVDGSSRTLSGENVLGLHADGDDSFILVYDNNQAQRFTLP